MSGDCTLVLSSTMNNGPSKSELPSPAIQDLPICQDPPTLDETRKAIQGMRNNRAAGVDHVITSEALQSGGEVMLEVIHKFCVEVFTSLTPPEQWTTNIIVPLPKKGDLSCMNNYRGITLMSIAAKVYNKILLTRIRDHVEPKLRSNQAGFRPRQKLCAASPYPEKNHGGFPESATPTYHHFHRF